MTLVLRSTRIARLFQGGSMGIGVSSQNNPASALDNAGTGRPLAVVPYAAVSDSFFGAIRANLAAVPYQVPLNPYAQRAPRRVAVWDDFEAATLKWNQVAGTVTRDTTTAGVFDGVASMKLLTGAAAGNLATAAVRRGYRGNVKFVVELWWAMTAAAVTTPRRFRVWVVNDQGTTSQYLEVAYVKNVTTPQNKWQYSADGTTYSDVTGGAETITVDTAVPYLWHYFRAHFDLSTATPTLSELHTDLLDLTGLSHAGGTPAASAPQTTWSIGGSTDPAAASTFVADDVTVSDQEV